MTDSAAPPRARVATAAVALGAFAAFRVPVLVRYPPWTDEVWTIVTNHRLFINMLRTEADDQTQPPLFFALLWFWRKAGGDALWWLRLLPCLFGILVALPVIAICRRARLGAEATALALAFVASSQLMIFYSDELRNYSLYALLAACSLAAWLRVRDDAAPRDVRLLTFVNVLLVYSHYFGCLVVAAEWLDALMAKRSRLRVMTASGALTAASLVPWVAFVVSRAMRSGDALGNAAWIPRPQIGDVLDPFRLALGRSPSLALDLALLVLVGGAIALLVVRARREQPMFVTLVVVALAPAVLAFSLSVLSPRSVWVTRYLLATAVPFLVLAGAAIVALLPARVRRFAVVVALWPAALSVAALADGREKVRFDQLADGIVAASPRGGADVYALDWVEGGPLRYQAARFRGALRVTLVPAVDSLTPASGWLLWSEHHPPRGLPPAAALLRRGYRTGPPLAVTGMYDDQLGRTDSVVALPFHRPRP